MNSREARDTGIYQKAHAAVDRAVRSGALTPKTVCEECKGTFVKRIHAHHDDYTKPLSVRWLCRSCHKKWHILNGDVSRAKRLIVRPPGNVLWSVPGGGWNNPELAKRVFAKATK